MAKHRPAAGALQNALYASTVAVVVSLSLLAFCLPAVLNTLEELSAEWSADLADVKRGNDEAWRVLMQSGPAGAGHRSRRNNHFLVARSGYNGIFENNNHNPIHKQQHQTKQQPQLQQQQTTPLYRQQESQQLYEQPTIQRAEYDGIPRPTQLYSYTKRPEFGYGYAKLRCCCALKDYQPPETLAVSYKCPAGPQGPSGVPGEPGTAGFDGRRGVDGRNFPTLAPTVFHSFDDDGYGIQSQFRGMLPASARNCGSCPQGPSGTPGPTGKVGSRGVTGVAGKHGIPGLHGKSGTPGSTGDIGPQGKSGHPGVSGQKGLDAVKGGKGAPGAKGTPGAIGATGSRGTSGPSGPAGAHGTLGPPGPPGIKGQRGMDGADGVAGDRGAPGRDALYCQCPIRTRSPLVPYGNVSPPLPPTAPPPVEKYFSLLSRPAYDIRESLLPEDKYGALRESSTTKSLFYQPERRTEFTPSNKYLVENTHPPSVQPHMPSYSAAYSYDVSARQFVPAHLPNSSDTTLLGVDYSSNTPAARLQTYGLPESTRYEPTASTTQRPNDASMAAAAKAARATTMMRADAYAYTPVFHKSAATTTTTTTSHFTTTMVMMSAASNLPGNIRTTTTTPPRGGVAAVHKYDSGDNNLGNQNNNNRIGRYGMEPPALPIAEGYVDAPAHAMGFQGYKSTDSRLLYEPDLYEGEDRNVGTRDDSPGTPVPPADKWVPAGEDGQDEQLPFEFAGTEWNRARKQRKSRIAH